MRPAAATTRAQALILLSEGQAPGKVAEKLKLHRTTLFRWMKEPGFAGELAALKPAEAPAPRPVPTRRAVEAPPSAPVVEAVEAPAPAPIAVSPTPTVVLPGPAPTADEDESLALNGLRYVVADPRAKGTERVAGAKALLDHSRKRIVATGLTAPTESAKPAMEVVRETLQAVKFLCGSHKDGELGFETKTVDEVTEDEVISVMIQMKDGEAAR